MMSAVLTMPSPTDQNASPSLRPTLVHVHPSQLLQPLLDIRDRSTTEYREFFDRLVADMKARGMQIPILAYWEADRPRILDGLTRYLAALPARLETVQVLVYAEKPDDSTLLLGQLQCNAMRMDMSDLEYASVYQQLMTLNKWSAAELWRQLKVNPATGTKRLAISTKLCEQLKALVGEGKLAVRAAYAISRIADVNTQIEVSDKFVRGALCVEGVEAEVNRILKGSKRPVKEKPIVFKIGDIEVTMQRSVSLETIATAFDGVAAVVKRLVKEKRGIEYLVLELQPT
jgi:ParB-like chromosome segregation protein Spo0J